MNVFSNRFRYGSLSVFAILLAAPLTHAGLLGPTPYLQPSDSPFAGGSYSYFYLEDFEDHAFNTPGVSASDGGVASIVFGPSFHDSVDADDGSIDGSGLKGDSFFASAGVFGITFTFDAALLGALPDDVGLVWTDGVGDVTFEAFDALGVSLGSITSSIADGAITGETGEDRFFGVTGAGGISKIFISNTAGGIEIDHLQYGLTSTRPPTNGVPDGLNVGGAMALVLAVLAFGRRAVARRA